MEALAAAGLNATQVMQSTSMVLALAKVEGVGMDVAVEAVRFAIDRRAGASIKYTYGRRLRQSANISTTSSWFA